MVPWQWRTETHDAERPNAFIQNQVVWFCLSRLTPGRFTDIDCDPSQFLRGERDACTRGGPEGRRPQAEVGLPSLDELNWCAEIPAGGLFWSSTEDRSEQPDSLQLAVDSPCTIPKLLDC